MMPPKIATMIGSRRFWKEVSGVLVIVFQEKLCLTPLEASSIAGMLMAWILGDSYRKTE